MGNLILISDSRVLIVIVIVVLEVEDGFFEVLSTSGDMLLGGDDCDKCRDNYKGFESGVSVKMITGDQLAIAKETGRRLGMGTNIYPSSALLEQHKDESIRALPVLNGLQKISWNSVISHSGSGQGSPLTTPDFMSARTIFGQQSVSFDLFLSSGGSSDLSVKEGFESSSIGSDSELELFDSSINKHSNPQVTSDVEGLSGTEEVKVTKKKIPNFVVEIQQNEDYEALLKRISKYDEELKETHKKLQLAEEVVVRLTGEFNKKEAFTVLIGDLQAQLDSAHGEIKVREADLEMEKRRGLELQMEIGNLVEELEIAREKLKVSEDESNEISQGKCQLQGQPELAQKFVATLESKLESEKMQVLELQEKIVKHIADVSKRDQEIKELNSTLSNAQKTFTLDEMKLQSDISALSEELALSEARAVESQLRRKLLEIEISKSEVARKKMVCLHEAQQNGLCNEVEQLKANIAERGKTVEALNKKLDVLKLKYDMLVVEKDGLDAKVQMLIAEMDSRDKQIKRLDEDTRQMLIECVELTIGSESAEELVDELRVRVGELEKEVGKQRIVISDRARRKKRLYGSYVSRWSITGVAIKNFDRHLLGTRAALSGFLS
ncbi:hypothetical protein RHMOL_Rhmol05G0035100 [Rhododendron molle]|uniref:Uncharacterized protein n=1 Tax=Rhododendron molle TaxID=49168 RepID=A0ACC0NM77_RHOML|nr:hypothetical protein RHMOL_Rhmol05G0035100 [Rhododendron molle]